jgi:hypothetical protein
MHGFFAFKLHNYRALDQHVGTKSAIEFDVLVYQRYSLLSFQLKPELAKLIGHTGFVRGFQQAQSELLVYLDASSNDFAGNLVNA